MKNYYDILGLSSYEDSQDVILDKYKEVTTQLSSHVLDKDMRGQLIAVNEAFLVLSDEELKKKYDYALSSNLVNEELLKLLALKRQKAEQFINDKLSNAPKKRKKNKWPAIICGFFLLSALGTISRTCSHAYMQEKSSHADIVQSFSTPSDWSEIKESMVSDFTESKLEFLSESHIQTEYGDLICLKPDMSRLTMDMICGEIPSADNDSIVLAFAGAFTGSTSGKGHINIAGNHVSGGKIYRGYRCKRNTGAFTWSPLSGPQFFYDDYQSAMEKAAREGGMGFAQEMMIHHFKGVKTARKLDNKNVFRALCLDKENQLALYESLGIVTFGNFINALLSQDVKEALYTDMGQGWNYCFYRLNADESSPKYLHDKPLPYASNFVVLKVKQ